MARRRLNTAGAENELGFQARVIGLFRVYGFERIFHAPAGGYQGRVSREQIPEGRGFPDLIALKDTRLVVAELKATPRLCKDNNLRPGQRAWLNAFAALPHTESYLWSPADWNELHDAIRGDMPRRRDLDPPAEVAA